jgi:flagellar hook capping protein FlgD/putative pyrroloquinoline-quinone-binding quinoprotein
MRDKVRSRRERCTRRAARPCFRHAPGNALLLYLTVFATAVHAQNIRSDLYVTFGTVNATAVSGNTLYIGGQFTQVGPATGCGVPLDKASGAPRTGFPRVVGLELMGVVNTAVSDGAGGWYIGGHFQQVGGVQRSHIAHILADNTVSSWDPDADGDVLKMALSGNTIYVIGWFSHIGGQPRRGIAALDAATGTATPWNPDPDPWSSDPAPGRVSVLALGAGVVYVGGGQAGFKNIGGQPRNRIAALDATTGLATSWNPNADGAVAEVFDLVVSGGTVYAAGAFPFVVWTERPWLAALDASTGEVLPWNPVLNANFYTSRLAVGRGTVYACGSINNTYGGRSIAAIDSANGSIQWTSSSTDNSGIFTLAVDGNTLYVGGWFTHLGGQSRNHLAALDARTGALLAWDPNANFRTFSLTVSDDVIFAGGQFTSIGGATRNNLAALDLTTGAVTAWNPNSNREVYTLAASRDTVYVGGAFTHVGGQYRSCIAALNATTGGATPWNPNANQEVHALALSGGGTLYAAGLFTSIGAQYRKCIAALDVATGAATPWNPDADGTVRELAVSGSSVYAAGDFTSIGGAPRYQIAALDASTGAATTWNPTTFPVPYPRDESTIAALAVSGGTVYVAGGGDNFERDGEDVWGFVTAFDATNGAVKWDTEADGMVSALAVGGNTLYVGGVFGSGEDYNHIGGQPRHGIAALDRETGIVTPWNPMLRAYYYPWVNSLTVSGGAVYVGGGFFGVGDLPQSCIAAIEAPVAVQVEDFAAVEGDAGVVLHWRLSANAVRELSGVVVQRAEAAAGPFQVLASSPLEPRDAMSFTDDEVPAGRTYWYRLVLLDAGGERTLSPTIQFMTGRSSWPTELRVLPVQTNATNVEIRFVVGTPGVPADLAVYDVAGRRVRSWRQEAAPPGEHVVVWDGRNAAGARIPRGVYFVRLAASQLRVAKKFVLVGN